MEPAGSAKRWSTAEKRRIEIPQPYLIGQYNKNMGGVDRMDQNIATYRISIRSRKWWWPLFAYMVDVAMQNAWLIYRLTGAASHRPMDQLDFRRYVCNVYYRRYDLPLAVLWVAPRSIMSECQLRFGLMESGITLKLSVHSVVVLFVDLK